MACEHRLKRRVEFADTDAAGIIHFASYFRYMEETEHSFLRSLGLSVDLRLGGRRFGFPRLAARCEFVRPLRFEDVVEVEIRVARKGRTSLTYQFRFTLDNAEVARGEISTACCLWRDGVLEAVELPQELAEKIEEAPYPPLEFGRRGARRDLAEETGGSAACASEPKA
jgi:YbgC/YbaW family acyl-CoA thioester hydrolase